MRYNQFHALDLYLRNAATTRDLSINPQIVQAICGMAAHQKKEEEEQ